MKPVSSFFWTRHGTENFLDPPKRIGVRLERAGTALEILDISEPLLLLAGGMIVPNDPDPDGCMVQ